MKPLQTYRIPELYAWPGALSELPVLAARSGAKRLLIVTDTGIVQSGILDVVVKSLKGNQLELLIESGISKEPSTGLVDKLYGRVKDFRPDLIVALGGGSPMDIAKLLSVMVHQGGEAVSYLFPDAVRTKGIPLIAIPTTAGTGSEVSPIAVFTDDSDGIKKAVVSRHLIPEVALLDAHLSLRMPALVTAGSGMDALTHAIEAYTSTRANAFSDSFAREAVRFIIPYLKTAVLSGLQQDARHFMLLGSFYAGIAFTNAGVAAVHALAYPLGGLYDVPHGVANSMLLPYVMQFNKPACAGRYHELARITGIIETEDAPSGADALIRYIKQLSRDIGIPEGLHRVNIPELAIPGMAQSAAGIKRLMDNNPRPVTALDAEQIYRHAYGDALVAS
ncbi:MAG: iron-containing alcohol dehydrogenase [Candidatus Cyclonatronum sp.]|uniref:iron-containing alcohol dehydrogenase n=1 Tax=Cyclonatronum sp. TaxID=3024185 RepID=UPI0025C12D53|nr:iron-containing alcohol dehydrogenase [Cyclonatronum sp.]MCC5932763.1 iron-containing alcohol dehydrogenase [Balneolales bacterium]MCH8486128.1 iron-containing alcohol dehydrogenase [Cyclonatronum sp.]